MPDCTSVFTLVYGAFQVASFVKILVGKDADKLVVELAALGDGEGRVPRVANNMGHFGDGLLGSKRDDVGLESRFEALYLAHLGTLLVYRLTNGQDANSAQLGE